ncbi:MAG TPA: DUF4390 domain-containing protein [Gammaproteobacteria bacterium]|nr:DUF4390 domain-containing protein [Gammaproteobacteria bacterium]
MGSDPGTARERPAVERRGLSCRRARAGTPRLVGLIALAAVLWQPAAAQDEGRFDIRSAYTSLRDGVYFLDARVEYRLSDAALEALESGVALTLELQIEVTRRRRFLPDPEVAMLRQRNQLQFHALSQRYVVRNLNSGEQASYATLYAALNAAGRIAALPLIDASLLDDDDDYDVQLRALLDVREIPGPLRLLAFWLDDWRLASEWYTWPLRP